MGLFRPILPMKVWVRLHDVPPKETFTDFGNFFGLFRRVLR